MSILPTRSRTSWTLRSAETGRDLVSFQSLIDADVTNSGKVLSFPVERGGFADYNKVECPLQIAVTLGFMRGNDDAIQAALDVLAEVKRNTTLFSLVTPDYEYADLTLESFNYSRKREDGTSSLYVELRLVEVRQVDTRYTTAAIPKAAAKNPSTASDVALGKKQPSSTLYSTTGTLIP